MDQVLNQSLARHNISKEFLLMAEQNNFHTLSHVLNTPLYKFHSLPGSGYRMLRELVNLLDRHGLMHLAAH